MLFFPQDSSFIKQYNSYPLPDRHNYLVRKEKDTVTGLIILNRLNDYLKFVEIRVNRVKKTTYTRILNLLMTNLKILQRPLLLMLQEAKSLNLE